MEYNDFIDLFKHKGKHFMWLMGAGTSVSAGIPSASNLIMDFKRTIFCKKTGENSRLFKDLSNPTTKRILDDYFSANDLSPDEGDNDYAYYFEKAYPDVDLRRRRISDAILNRKPSYGHDILAVLMKLEYCRIVWTTNFDKLIEDAVHNLYGTSNALTVSTLEGTNLARQAITNEQWPLLVKLHGDFQSERLKNIEDELHQDKEYRKTLEEQCKNYGLIVIGYSGRDSSILNALEDAFDNGRGFPHGLFWLLRHGEEPSKTLTDFIDKAKSLKINAEIIFIHNFDETLADMVKQIENIPSEIQEYLNQKMPKATFPPLPPRGTKYPLIRLNAVPVIDYPTTCKLIECEIGGSKDVKQAIDDSGTNIIAARRKIGVIALGKIEEIKNTFAKYNIKNISNHDIENRKLKYESQEFNILYKALTYSFQEDCPVITKGKRGTYFLVLDKNRFKYQLFAETRCGSYTFKEYVTGRVPETSLVWTQAVKIQLEYRFNNLWLILEPTIWIDISEDNVEMLDKCKAYINGRLSKRYNQSSNQLLDAWIELLIGKNQRKTVKLFNSLEEESPAFTLQGITAFSCKEGDGSVN